MDQWRWILRGAMVMAAMGGWLGAGVQEPVLPLVFNTQEFAPFTYLQRGEVSGPAVEVVRAVCREMGQPCDFNLMPWARAQVDVRTGRADALFLIGWNAERAAWLHPSVPLFASEYGFFVQAGNPLVFQDMTQLKGYRVAVYGPSNTSMTLEGLQHQAPGLSIDRTSDDDAAFRKLEASRVDAVFSNRAVGLVHMERMHLRNVRYAGAQSQVAYVIGFSALRVPMATVERFNEAYRRLLRSGEVRRILKPYRMEPAPLEWLPISPARSRRGSGPGTWPGRAPGPPSG